MPLQCTEAGYTNLYRFTLSLESPTSPTQQFFNERSEFFNNLQKNKYIDFIAITSPYMSINKPIMITKETTRVYLSDTQVSQILLMINSNARSFPKAPNNISIK